MEIGHDEMRHSSEEQRVGKRADLVAVNVDLDELRTVDDHGVDRRQIIIGKDANL